MSDADGRVVMYYIHRLVVVKEQTAIVKTCSIEDGFPLPRSGNILGRVDVTDPKVGTSYPVPGLVAGSISHTGCPRSSSISLGSVEEVVAVSKSQDRDGMSDRFPVLEI